MPRKKPVEQGPACANCLHWKERTDQGDEVRWGECRRYPPSGVVARNPITDEEQPEAVWPPTDPQDFCGEWKAAQ